MAGKTAGQIVLFFVLSSILIWGVMFGYPFFYSWFKPSPPSGVGKGPTVKNNMRSLQDMVEYYALETKGVYPNDLASLRHHPSHLQYWKELMNPYQQTPGATALSDAKKLEQQVEKGECKGFEGQVLYLATGMPAHDYRIFGCDAEGHLLRDNFGKGTTYYSLSKKRSNPSPMPIKTPKKH